MKIAYFKVNMNFAYTHAQLIKGGWNVEEKDKFYYKLKGKFKYNYVIKSFGKIKVSEIYGMVEGCEKLNYETISEFDFEESWLKLWNKSFTPDSVEIIIKENIFEKLIDIGFKPAVFGVIEYVNNGENLSYYYPSPENENFYKLVDDNPGDVIKFPIKLKNFNIF